MKAILTCISLSLIVFTGDILAQGSTYRAGEIVRISEKDSIFTQTFATGETIEMFGWIGNDLVSASESLIIEGEIMDDAIITGGNLTLRGTVHDMLAAAGETIVIDGQVFGDIFAVGATIRITDNAVIKGNAHLAGQRIIFDNGIIEGYLKVAGSELELNGMVQQKTEIYGHDIKFGPQYNATLGTDIYTDQAVYPENFSNPPGNLNIYETEQDVLGIILFNGALYLSLFITGVLLISIFKKASRDLYRFSTEQFWKNTGVGFLTFLFYPMVVVLLAILVLTIPISILLLLLYGLILLFGYLLVALVIGVSSFRFLKKSDSDINYYWGLFVGMILLAIIVNLPFLGWLFHSVFIFFGLGSMILYLWEMKNLSTSQVEADT